MLDRAIPLGVEWFYHFTPSRMAGNMARTKDPDSQVYVKVGLRPKQWAHVMGWKPGDTSETRNLCELVDRSMKMFPEGPGKFGHLPDPDKPRTRRRIPGAVAQFAARQGVSRNDALAEIAARYIAEHPEEFRADV